MSFSLIHNYYEQLVFRRIDELIQNPMDDNFTEDVACVALNHLPAKYVRHEVDMAFYMTSKERSKINSSVNTAVQDAINYVNQHRDTYSKRA